MTEEEQIKIMEHELRHFGTFFEKLAWMKFEFDHDPKFTREARTIVLRNAAKGDPAYGRRFLQNPNAEAE